MMLIMIINLFINLIESALFYYVISHCLEIKYNTLKRYFLLITDFCVITFSNYFIDNTTISVLFILVCELIITHKMTTFAFIVVQVRKKNLTFPFYVLIFLFIICMIGMFSIHVLLWSIVEVEKVPTEANLNQVSLLLTFCCFAFIGVFILLYVLLFIIGNIHKRNLDYIKEKEMYELERNHYHTLHKTYKLLRVWKHEFSDHLQTISQLHNSNDFKNAKHYVNQLTEGFEHTSIAIDTGNATIDAVVSLKKYEANNLNIQFEHELFLPEASRIPLNNVLLASLLNNLLNNAIEASIKTATPLIHLTMKLINSSLFIEVINSSIGNYKYDTDKKLISIKKEEWHGIGLTSREGFFEKTFLTE